MERKQIRRLVVAVIGVVLLVTAMVSLSRRQPLPTVAAAGVARENLSALIPTNGKVEPVQPYVLRAESSSFIQRVAAVEGRAVRRGDLLLELDATEARAELARMREALLQAEDDLRAARAGGRPDELAQLESDLRKTSSERERLRSERAALERLLAKQAATQAELDQNRVALEKAEAEMSRLEARKAELARRAKLDVERAELLADRARNAVAALEQKVRQAELTSPVDGILYLLPVRAGDYVRTGDLLAEVADLRRVRVRAFVDEPDLGQVESGQPVDITWDALPNRSWHGSTEQVPKTVVARGARTVGEVLCSVENDRIELLPNTNVNVSIRVRERRNALVVPRGAVRSEGPHRYVYLVEDGALGVQGSRLRKHEIHVGIASATNFEVLDGLSDGDRVALPGDVDLADGIQVRVTLQK